MNRFISFSFLGASPLGGNMIEGTCVCCGQSCGHNIPDEEDYFFPVETGWIERLSRMQSVTSQAQLDTEDHYRDNEDVEMKEDDFDENRIHTVNVYDENANLVRTFAGASVSVEGPLVHVTSPKGEVHYSIPSGYSVHVEYDQ